jgi:hypothetical protein
MNAENTKKLLDKYPLIYSGYTRPMTESLMCFGFECDDGWFELLDTFSALAEAYVQHHELDIEIVQVKEKFGGLVIYMDYGDDYLFNLAGIIENESFRTCEVCGIQNNMYDDRKEKGKPIENNEQFESCFAKVTTGPLAEGTRGWIISWCDTCRKEEIKRRNETIRKENLEKIIETDIGVNIWDDYPDDDIDTKDQDTRIYVEGKFDKNTKNEVLKIVFDKIKEMNLEEPKFELTDEEIKVYNLTHKNRKKLVKKLG